MWVQLLESFEGLHDHIEVVRVGDVFDLTEACFDVLDVHFCRIGLRADLYFVGLFDVFGMNDARLIDSPVIGMQIKLIILIAGPKHFILIDQLAGVKVFISYRVAVLRCSIIMLEW